MAYTDYTFDELMSKTNSELLTIAEGLGVRGCAKKAKSFIVSKIMDELTRLSYTDEEAVYNDDPCDEELDDDLDVPQGFDEIAGDNVRVTTTVNVENTDTGDTGSATLSCGANTVKLDVVNKSIKDIIVIFKDVLNISNDAKTVVNGKPVEDNYRVKNDDNVEFVKNAGSKGC